MDVLVIGGGGREHAIVTALSKSKDVEDIYCMPGNTGIASLATCLPVAAGDKEKTLEFLKAHGKIGLTVVAPDNPLADGMVNFLEENGYAAFGPTAEAAIIESSKSFSKEFMKRHSIPTASYFLPKSYEEAYNYISEKSSFPVVIKADGLAFGKGVIICSSFEEAEKALKSIMLENAFGKENSKVVIEEFLEGREVSVLVFTDGKSYLKMPSAQDHKRAFDNDLGPNTGGMGAFSHSPFYSAKTDEYVEKNVILPTIKGLSSEGRTFKGVIYFGLMMTANGVFVIEYNARFGDPETQAVLPLLKSDFLDILVACREEKLSEVEAVWEDGFAVTVVAASGGYPAKYETGKPITINKIENAEIYHAGTSYKDGKLVSSGGRVLTVTAKGKSIEEARKKAYLALENINFEGMFYRKDIGKEKNED